MGYFKNLAVDIASPATVVGIMEQGLSADMADSMIDQILSGDVKLFFIKSPRVGEKLAGLGFLVVCFSTMPNRVSGAYMANPFVAKKIAKKFVHQTLQPKSLAEVFPVWKLLDC